MGASEENNTLNTEFTNTTDDCSDLITISHECLANGICVISADGVLEITTEELLRQEVQKVIEDGHNQLIFDFSKISFIDSSGLAAVLSTLRRVRERGGMLRLVSNSRSVIRVLQLTGIDGLLDVCATLKDALENLPTLSGAAR